MFKEAKTVNKFLNLLLETFKGKNTAEKQLKDKNMTEHTWRKGGHPKEDSAVKRLFLCEHFAPGLCLPLFGQLSYFVVF